MQLLSLCFAKDDADSASALASFLQLNGAAAAIDRQEFTREEDNLIDVADRALACDILLLLLSPNAMPNVWTRSKWEPVLVGEARRFGTRVVYVLLKDCKFPEIFRRGRFFDLSKDRLAGQRALKRWLFRQNPFFTSVTELPELAERQSEAPEALDYLTRTLADRPGTLDSVPRELALEFAHLYAADFEGVFWLPCAHRSRAGILGDTARALGLSLRGNLEQNTAALQQFCAGRRLLFVFEYVAPCDRELVSFGGKNSVIFSGEQAPPVNDSLARTTALFSAWPTGFDACLNALGDAQAHLRQLSGYREERWYMAISLGSAAFHLLKHAGRLAEAAELLRWLIDATQARGDLVAASRWEWEETWILEEWGEAILPHSLLLPSSQPVQLDLQFAT